MRPRLGVLFALVVPGLAGCFGVPSDLPRFDHPLPTVAPREILDDLHHGRWQRLEKRFEELERRASEDPDAEHDLLIAYGSFESSLPWVLDALKAWRTAAPDSLAARSALARHELRRGWRERGGALARDTSEARFERMREQFALAEAEARAVLDRDPKRVQAWIVLMSIAMSEAGPDLCLELSKQALEHRPWSFGIRRQLQACLRPSWGGSYLAMRLAASQAREEMKRNPRLACLYGFSEAERSFQAVRREDYDEALKRANAALATGPHPRFYEARGTALAGLGRHDEALYSFSLALDLQPDDPDDLAEHAEQAILVHNETVARNDVSRLRAIDPAFGNLGWLETRLDEEFGGGDDTSTGDRGELAGGAEGALRHALDDLSVNPGDATRVRVLVDVAAPAGRWQEVVDAWERYLEFHPDDTQARIERAAALTRLGRSDEAIAELQRVCELGEPEGCRLASAVSRSAADAKAGRFP